MSERAFRSFSAAVLAMTVTLIVIAATSQADPSRIASAASIAVAGATLLLAAVTYKSVTEARRAAQEQQRALARPILVPAIPTEGGDLVNASSRIVGITNVGTGVALNIHGILMPVSHPVAGLPRQLSVHYPFPVRAEERKQFQFQEGGTMFDAGDMIAGVPVSVPPELEPDQGVVDTLDRRDRVVARLTLTYQDLFSGLHASVFDLTQMHQWVAVAIKPEIQAGIREIDEHKTVPRKPRRSPPNRSGT